MRISCITPLIMLPLPLLTLLIVVPISAVLSHNKAFCLPVRVAEGRRIPGTVDGKK